MGFTSDACWFLLLKSLLIKINKKREAALKSEAGGDEKHVFFTWPNVDLQFIPRDLALSRSLSAAAPNHSIHTAFSTFNVVYCMYNRLSEVLFIFVSKDLATNTF